MGSFSLKFTENSTKSKQIHNASKRTEKVREKTIISWNKSGISYKFPKNWGQILGKLKKIQQSKKYL